MDIISTVDRIDYSNDTATVPTKGPLSSVRYNTAGASAGENALPTDNGIIDNLLHTAAEPRDNVLPQGTDFGYFGGGYDGSSHTSSVDRIDYSNDTATTVAKGPLSVNRTGMGSVGNASFGYFGAGSPGPLTSVDRIDYNNDTATAATKGPLTVVRYYLAATGNSDFGYFGGGQLSNNTSITSTVDRIDYSTDTATASPKGPLSLARDELAATGNASFGYFGGGALPLAVSTVDRIDYSNDTDTASPKGPLSNTVKDLSATGNANFGYFAGGQTPSIISTVDRVDYSNDTATASPKGPLSTAKFFPSATGDQNFGYFGGGYNPALSPARKSTIDRVDYSNDTATASPKGPLNTEKSASGASSSRANAIPLKGPAVLELPVSFGVFSAPGPQGTNFGYFGGGIGAALRTTVDRIDYSNDTGNQ